MNCQFFQPSASHAFKATLLAREPSRSERSGQVARDQANL